MTGREQEPFTSYPSFCFCACHRCGPWQLEVTSVVLLSPTLPCAHQPVSHFRSKGESPDVISMLLMSHGSHHKLGLISPKNGPAPEFSPCPIAVSRLVSTHAPSLPAFSGCKQRCGGRRRAPALRLSRSLLESLLVFSSPRFSRACEGKASSCRSLAAVVGLS